MRGGRLVILAEKRRICRRRTQAKRREVATMGSFLFYLESLFSMALWKAGNTSFKTIRSPERYSRIADRSSVVEALSSPKSGTAKLEVIRGNESIIVSRDRCASVASRSSARRRFMCLLVACSDDTNCAASWMSPGADIPRAMN